MTAPLDPPLHIEHALAEARSARGRGDVAEARAVLDAALPVAATMGPEHSLRQVLAWRASKAAFDLGDTEAALLPLAPLVTSPEVDPFEHYPAGLGACVPLTHAAWSTLGYRRPVVRDLLARCRDAHRRREDPYQAWQIELQRAWDLACGGDLVELDQLLEDVGRLTPASLDGAPTRHPRAIDGPTSVPFLQLDLARTALRAATWARDPERADRAEDVMEGAADDAGIERETDYWFLEPMALARRRLQRADPDDYVSMWIRLAPAWSHPRASYHRALARAEAATSVEEGIRALDDAARQAHFQGHGPEWEISPTLEAARRAHRRPDAVASLVESHQVHVFADPLAALSA